jgi:RING finger protein 113A
MFKKPKKNPKAKFRSIKRAAEEDHDDDGAKKIKRDIRVRDQESTADDEASQLSHENHDGNQTTLEASTSLLLQKAKMEQRQKNGGRVFQGTSHKKSDTKKVSIQSIHQQYDYKTTSNNNHSLMSEKDLATRSAEYHPITEKKNAKNHDDDDAADDKERQRQGTIDNNVVIYKGNQEPRNKFLAGPLKAPTFVRTTSRFDYQPDICKDYKDTGFCGFGDSCIYLHDRGNTLTGWQLEEQYEKMKKLQQDKKMREMDMFCQEISGDDEVVFRPNDESVVCNNNEGDGQDDLPFACYLCRKPFTDPVVTSCNHYFCQKCIMKYVQDDAKSGRNGSHSLGVSSACPICHRDTHGVFNYPNKLYQKKRRMECSSWEEFAKKSSGQ